MGMVVLKGAIQNDGARTSRPKKKAGRGNCKGAESVIGRVICRYRSGFHLGPHRPKKPG